MAHAQKPDLVFRRNGRVHLNRRGRQFSRLLAAEVCASAVVMLDKPCSEVAWEYWLPTPFASFPFTSPPVRHRVPSGFNWTLPLANWISTCKCFVGLPPKIPLNNGRSFCGLEPDHIERFLELSWAYIIKFTFPLAIGKLRQCSKTLRVIPVLLLMVRISFLYARRLCFVKPTFGTHQIICVHHGSDAIKRNLYSCGLLTISLPCTSLPRLLLRLNR
jgi:hypothetical protein